MEKTDRRYSLITGIEWFFPDYVDDSAINLTITHLNSSPGILASRGLRASGDAGCFGPAGAIGLVAIVRFPGAGDPLNTPWETGSRAGFLKISWVRQDADHSGANSASRPARSPRHPPTSPDAPMFGSGSGRIRSVARNSQRGVVLPGGDSWVAGYMTIFQRSSASVGFQEGIQPGTPPQLLKGTRAPLDPAPPARPIDPRLASRQRRSPPAPATGPEG